MMLPSSIRRVAQTSRRTVGRARRKALGFISSRFLASDALVATDVSVANGSLITLGGFQPEDSRNHISELWFASRDGQRFECRMRSINSFNMRWQATGHLPVGAVSAGAKTWKAYAVSGGKTKRVTLRASGGDSLPKIAAVSPDDGTTWTWRTQSGALLLIGEPAPEQLYVERLTVHMGSIICHIRASATVPDGEAVLVVRKRKARVEVRIPFQITGGRGEVRVKGEDVLASDVAAQTGQPVVWDVLMEHSARDPYRVRSGLTDIEDPRAVFKYAAAPFHSGSRRRFLRPYWTLDGYLSLEIKGGQLPAVQPEGTGS
ncbi:hypothetical protein SAMN04489742_3914 [Arthrobacter crystallopoietes]|uniref:Uncharacterized protein n=1 Tax=Crystallibacter crystallopoietes TaxID=37928 RepID=A0A1H1G8C4_9MICC|nr:hypothetical protein SAMN04489742_3914 [Arthrobacter crystallopoietes]